MFFLVEYDRKRGQIVSFKSFDEANRLEADESRLALELELRRLDVEREVVLLEAADEDALRRTHRRYFENVDSLARTDR